MLWLNTWFDPAKEREAAMSLINQQADVLSFHTASTAVMAAAQERGKLAIATVMLLGHVCTRGCRFCAVTTISSSALPDCCACAGSSDAVASALPFSRR